MEEEDIFVFGKGEIGKQFYQMAEMEKMNTMEDLNLKDIASKLSDINKKLETIFECLDNFKEMKEILMNLSEFKMDITQNAIDLDLLHYSDFQDSTDKSSGYIQDVNSVIYNSKRIRKYINQTWKRSLNERKQAFWNNFKLNNTIEIYEEWLERENMVIPRKFRPRLIEGEIEEDRQIRHQTAIFNFQSEIRIMKNKALRYQNKYLQMDDQMYSLIKQKSYSDREVEEYLISVWNKDCLEQENKSKEIWVKKKIWLANYATNFGNDIFLAVIIWR